MRWSPLPDLEYATVGGLRIAFRRAGHGPPLVLLHGALCDSRVWHAQLADLSDEFTVVAWDAPGCGGSADPPETFRLPEYADRLAGLVAELGLAQPHILGHSFGAGLALELYRRHPPLPSSLLLAGGYAGWAGSLPPEAVEQRRHAALAVAQQLSHGRFSPESVPGLFSSAMSDDQAAYLAQIMSDIRPAATRVMAHAFAAADLRDVLPLIEVPTLLIYGSLDERSPLAIAEQLSASIPDAQLVVLPGLGHESYVESPTAFDGQVRRFLADIP